MNNYTISEQEQREAQKIRNEYVPEKENTMVQLKKLNQKVKRPGSIVSIALGIMGALVMGAGMSLVMVWSNMGLGLVMGIAGLVAALLAYPVYSLITNKRKKQYAPEIMNISNSITAQ